MLAARICLIAAATLGLNACTGGGDTPPAPLPPTDTSTVSEPVDTSAAPAPPQAAPVAVPESRITTPAPEAVSKVAAPVIETPEPIAQPPQPAALPDVSLTLDLDALKERLKETKSIGLFSKISLKNKVDDLLDEFRKYYQGKGKLDLAELHESYNLLMMKVLSMLQDEDESLAAAIVSSRGAIWELLSDPEKFAALDI